MSKRKSFLVDDSRFVERHPSLALFKGLLCVGWSSLWTDLWLLPALVFLNEMFSWSVLENGVGGVKPCDDDTACKSLEDVCDYVFKLATGGETAFC